MQTEEKKRCGSQREFSTEKMKNYSPQQKKTKYKMKDQYINYFPLVFPD
jgi:hypothetical protein